MKITPIANDHIEVETEGGHNFSVYGLVGGGIEIHPSLPEQEMVGEVLHDNRTDLDSYDSIDQVILRIKTEEVPI